MGRVDTRGVMVIAVVLAAALGLVPALAQQDAAGKLVEQIRVAVQHASFSLDSDTLQARHLHAHHVINIIEGTRGANFDASKGNPGDGYGAIHYARDAGQGATGSAALWAENAATYLQWADEAALAAVRTQDFAAAGEAVQRALASLSAALGRPDDQGRLGAALALAEAPAAAEVTIPIQGFVYGNGQPVTVSVGTTVTWVNHDAVPHTVTGGPLQSPMLGHGATFTFTFTQAGQFDYICAVHPTMKHTVIVTD